MKKSKGTMTVEQLVRKCFCPESKRLLSNFNIQLYALVNTRKDVLHLARCARRFVRMENEQKELAKAIKDGNKARRRFIAENE